MTNEAQKKKELERLILENAFKKTSSKKLGGEILSEFDYTKEYLDYLPFREQRVELLVDKFRIFLETQEDKLRTFVINGSGSTSVLKRFRHLIEDYIKNEEVIFVSLDCGISHGINRLYGLKDLTRRITKKSWSDLFEESNDIGSIQKILLDILTESEMKIVIVFERFNRMNFGEGKRFLQDLLKVKDMGIKSGLFYIFQTYVQSKLYKKDKYEFLPDTEYMELDEYTETELRDILEFRFEKMIESLNILGQAKSYITDETLDLMVFSSFYRSGVSTALELLKFAGMKAFEEGYKILPDHVRAANKELGLGGYQEEIYEDEVSPPGKIVLLGILEELDKNKEAFVTFSRAVELYKENRKKYDKKILNEAEIWDAIDFMDQYSVLWYLRSSKISKEEWKTPDTKITLLCYRVDKSLKLVKNWLKQS